MIRTTICFLLVTAMACAQQDHQAQVNEHGDHVMGFPHEKTTHHFELNQQGGLIEVRTNNLKDTVSRDQIRDHFQHIVRMFANGNFDAPMLVHSTAVPGTAAMTKLRSQIHWALSQTPRGARINITTDSKEALDAVHEFLRFQIGDHQTGDCMMVR